MVGTLNPYHMPKKMFELFALTGGRDAKISHLCPLRPSNNFRTRSHQVKLSLPDIYVQYFKCQIRKILNLVNKFQLMGMKLSACVGTKVGSI